jgi:hypothetical protein
MHASSLRVERAKCYTLCRFHGRTQILAQMASCFDGGSQPSTSGASSSSSSSFRPIRPCVQAQRRVQRLPVGLGGGIRFEGRDLRALDPAGRRHYRKSVQAVFQDPFASLNPRMRVSAIIAEPLVTATTSSCPARYRAAAAAAGLPFSLALPARHGALRAGGAGARKCRRPPGGVPSLHGGRGGDGQLVAGTDSRRTGI